MPKIPTVKVKNPDAPDQMMIVNKSDYDPKVHKLWRVSTKAKATTGDKAN